MKCLVCGETLTEIGKGIYLCKNCGERRRTTAQTTITVCDSRAYREGWVCPKCGAVLSPYINFCPYCAPKLSDVITRKEKLRAEVDKEIEELVKKYLKE